MRVAKRIGINQLLTCTGPNTQLGALKIIFGRVHETIHGPKKALDAYAGYKPLLFSATGQGKYHSKMKKCEDQKA